MLPSWRLFHGCVKNMNDLLFEVPLMIDSSPDITPNLEIDKYLRFLKQEAPLARFL